MTTTNSTLHGYNCGKQFSIRILQGYAFSDHKQRSCLQQFIKTKYQKTKKKLYMASGMSFPERAEIETPEWEYNSDFVKKSEKDFILIINTWAARETICTSHEK